MIYIPKICVDCGAAFDAPTCAHDRMDRCRPCQRIAKRDYLRAYARNYKHVLLAHKRTKREEERNLLAEAVDSPVSEDRYQCRAIGCAISAPGRNWR